MKRRSVFKLLALVPVVSQLKATKKTYILGENVPTKGELKRRKSFAFKQEYKLPVCNDRITASDVIAHTDAYMDYHKEVLEAFSKRTPLLAMKG